MPEPVHTGQVVVFTLDGEQYALPITRVHEVVRYTRPRTVASTQRWNCGVLSLRGTILPVYDLAARLGTSAQIGEGTKIMIVEAASTTAGIIVDHVDEVLTVTPDALDPVPGADPTLINAIAHIDDRLVVLLEPETLFGN
jgi:purine-binding chemotaxis protein CheW